MRLYWLVLIFGIVSGHGEYRSLKDTVELQTILTNSTGLGDVLAPIVGGQQAPQGRYPFFVQGNGCGASLVWADVVLTAAHCRGRFDGQVLVSAERKNWPQGGAVYKKTLSSMMFHPMNQVGTYKYDFMMFKIEPVENYEYKIMQLNGSPASPTEGEVLTVIGMGYTQEGGPSTEILNQVDVMAFSTSQCQASYGSSIIPEAMLCAGWPQGGKDSCNGDSGAPLFNSQGQQVGLTSFGSGCARAGKPGVYARISGAKDWIDQTICSLSSYPPSWCFAQQAPISTLTVNQPVAPPTQRPTPPPSRYPTLPPTLPPVPVATPMPTRYPTHPPIPVPVVPIPTPQPTVMFQQQGFAATNNDEAATTYRIVVQYDRKPNQVKWLIREGSKKIRQSNYNSGAPESGVVTESLLLKSGHRYKLIVRDQGGDGFCCDEGMGKIEVIATVNGVDQHLVNMLADIGWYKRITFTAP